MVIIGTVGVLAFAALGVRQTLNSASSAPSRVLFGLLQLAVLTFATIGVLDTLRGSALRGIRALGSTGRMVPVDNPIFRTTMELLTGTPLTPGNMPEVMTCGDQLYPRLWGDLRAAQRSISIQLYYCEPGRMAEEMRALLVERSQMGVRVFVLVDAFGAQDMPVAWLSSLRNAGVEVATFRPVHWWSLNRANNRSHVRAIAIDRKIGYTGGFGLADKWFGDGRSRDEWRDTSVRFTGPAVGQLVAAFAIAWAEATGDLLTVDTTPDELTPAGSTSGKRGLTTPVTSGVDTMPVAGFLLTPPSLGSTRAERFLSLSIAAARHRLYISNAYFVPDTSFRRLLEKAAKAGVDVRVVTAGPATDVRTMLYAGRARYTALLKAGVRIYEYVPSMMHAKTIVVDGLWSAIGSMNFDNRSMVLNDEANFVSLDPDLGRCMEDVFATDVTLSHEITLAEFGRRPWWHVARERLADVLTRVL